ncbi:MAG: ABC transporter permease [Thermoleophilaceae bacterium]
MRRTARPGALRRLLRSRAALAAAIALALIVAACLAAPLWADHVAETGPDTNHLTDTVTVDGEERDVVSLDGVPIGPTWQGRYFLGADANGRDVMVRLLYGGRNSLLIALAASALCLVLAVAAGLVAGYARGFVDAAISAALDVLWSFPVVILGVALGVALALGGLQVGPLVIDGGSLLIPMLVIGVVFVPYVARPIRAQARSLREREFVDAARVSGASPARIMLGELLPNLASTIAVFVALLVANAILLEAALSFLGAGVQPPTPSWGTMIRDGVDLLTSAPHLALAPGIAIVATVLAVNALGDAVRDALDPRAPVGLERGAGSAGPAAPAPTAGSRTPEGRPS